ncbi:MAG: DUF5681 domain-containing protein [Hyphomonadaceae bacterium]
MSEEAKKRQDPDYEVGYGKPPKHSRFKKGQSGCPGGGRKRKFNDSDARGAASKKSGSAGSEREETEEQEKEEIFDVFLRVMNEEVSLLGPDGEPVRMSGVEAMFRRLRQRALKGEMSAMRAIKQLFGKRLEPRAPQSSGGLVVVYAPVSQEQWEADSAGPMLPLNPLEGIPGAEDAFKDPDFRVTRGAQVDPRDEEEEDW